MMKSKNPLVSIIIPTKNSESHIEALLKSIKQQSYKKIEIIVVDNNSADKTKHIAKKYTKNVFNKGPERSAQRNFGASKAKGEYLLFIDSDMILTKSVVKECVEVAQNTEAKGIVIPEKSIGEGFWARCKALERSFYLGIDWLEAPRFFSKQLFLLFRGYDEKQTGTEDYDLPQRIKQKHGNTSIGRIKSFIIHDEGRLSLLYTLKKKFYYVGTSQNYVKKEANRELFKKQSSIIERYKLFLINPQKLFSNPLIGSGMIIMKTSEFIAGGLGYIRNNDKIS
jgi:glycosyltransferase involved in cell wall biosynthesis